MKKRLYFLLVCVGLFYACKDEEQVLLNGLFRFHASHVFLVLYDFILLAIFLEVPPNDLTTILPTVAPDTGLVTVNTLPRSDKEKIGRAHV